MTACRRHVSRSRSWLVADDEVRCVNEIWHFWHFIGNLMLSERVVRSGAETTPDFDWPEIQKDQEDPEMNETWASAPLLLYTGREMNNRVHRANGIVERSTEIHKR